jgi:hypothetical protein
LPVADPVAPEVVARLAQRFREMYATLPDEEKLLFEEFCGGLANEDEVAAFAHDLTTFDPGRRFVGVLMQQGRVQLDADSNEQAGPLARSAKLAMPLLGTWPPR